MITLWHVLVACNELVAIGHRCAQQLRDGEQCDEIAAHEAAWPGGGYKPICGCHLAKVEQLAAVFDFVLPVRPLGVWIRPNPDDTAQRFAMMELN